MSEVYHAAQLPFDFSQEPPVEQKAKRQWHRLPRTPDIKPERACKHCGHAMTAAWVIDKKCKAGGRWNLRCYPCKDQRARQKNPTYSRDRTRLYRAKHPHARKGQGARAYQRQRLAINGVSINLSKYKSKFGLTRAECLEMLEDQHWLCAICGKPESVRNAYGQAKPLSLDHDHATGKVRAWLCQNCNHALGRAEDSPERLRAMADYLEKHGKEGTP